jgi:tetratricopeptide (TPR) repeat protein
LVDQIAGCTAVVQANPQNDAAYYLRGGAYLKLHQYDQAIADFDEEIRLDPQDADAYDGRGNAYKELGQTDRAQADFDQAHRLDPDVY